MKKLSLLIGLLLILTVGVLPATAITWGEVDGNDHPYVGLISRPDPNNPDAQRPFCSGTLIHPRVLLTAGHCTIFLEGLIAAGQLTVAGVKVSFDADNALKDGLRDVEEIITHPDYNWGPSSNPHDVGALILKKRANRISIPDDLLPDEGLLDDLEAAGQLLQGSEGEKFTLVGYGTTLEWPPPVIIFPDGVRRRAESEFQALLKAWLRMSQNQATDDGGTCFGDSGGPAFWTDPTDGSETLVGITSWGDAQCVATGFNYRVDIPETLDFIEDVIASLD